MERLNYHHLLYFWLVAREGSVSKAAARLQLAQPTLSGQIRTLESALGERLFEKSGRRLRLTEVGRTTYRFADEIFSLGQELVDTLKSRPGSRPLRLTIGLADVVAKPVAYRLIRPLLEPPVAIRPIVREDSPEKLLAALVAHELDVVLVDAPPGPETGVRVFSHLLGQSGVTLLATPELARRHRRKFPKGLDGAPFLLPGRTTGLRRGLEQWFDRHQIHPRPVGEFDDSALIMEFGRGGGGIFAIPSVVERQVRAAYGLVRVGQVPSVREQLFVVSLQRRFSHPGVLALTERGRSELYG
jgi:LysR family transcriptional activator of nhaA